MICRRRFESSPSRGLVVSPGATEPGRPNTYILPVTSGTQVKGSKGTLLSRREPHIFVRPLSLGVRTPERARILPRPTIPQHQEVDDALGSLDVVFSLQIVLRLSSRRDWPMYLTPRAAVRTSRTGQNFRENLWMYKNGHRED